MNEKRLIDANAFECVCVNGKSDDFCNGVLYVLDMIDAQPTVDAVEVVHGRWIHHRCLLKDVYICNICHKFQLAKGNYCPSCGANMMDGGNEDGNL